MRTIKTKILQSDYALFKYNDGLILDLQKEKNGLQAR